MRPMWSNRERSNWGISVQVRAGLQIDRKAF
jgi:hypothetical protein